MTRILLFSYLFLSSSASCSLIVIPIFLKAEIISFKHNLPARKEGNV